jgi:peptidoglycan/LPS O-acetylase OafA/YrhL
MALQEGTAGETRTRVLPETRLLAAVIAPFLVAAWVILYLQPDRTGDLFAWPVSPSMTAMLLGGVYLGGACFFVRAVSAPDWERMALGLLPVAGFATLLIATSSSCPVRHGRQPGSWGSWRWQSRPSSSGGPPWRWRPGRGP